MNTPNFKSLEELFGEDLIEAVRSLLAQAEAEAQKISESFKEMIDEREADPDDCERIFWREAASFARSRMAARAQAFARQMEHQKARQVMKRRKLLHAEGRFPDRAH